MEAFLLHFKDRVYHDWTLNIPYPYERRHAEGWLAYRAQCREQGMADGALALRREDGMLVGAVGCAEVELGHTWCAELGYWLAREYWGKGTMTRAVAWYVDYAWRTLGLGKLSAMVFEGNEASMRVLESNGFEQEGQLKRHVRKGGRVLDARLYGLLRPERGEAKK